MVLDGKTPAEQASVDLNLEGNTWLSLIEQSFHEDANLKNLLHEQMRKLTIEFSTL